LFYALTYRGKDLTFDGKEIPLDVFGTYEETLKSRRRHLFFPAVLTGLGIIAFVVSFFFVLVPEANQPGVCGKSHPPFMRSLFRLIAKATVQRTARLVEELKGALTITAFEIH
jgi:hypothetical protein